MSTTIHPLACVHPNAKIGDNVEIGPYAYVDEFVEIGDGCKILSIMSEWERIAAFSLEPLWELSLRTSSLTER